MVLLDEADVFLEARKDDSPESSERNALVAVFLRHLEYFSGIVFLTTNRIHVFDTAMKSRVHMALGYAPPSLEMRRLIWTQSLGAVPQEETDIDIDDAVDHLIGEDLNGREITNAINTARTLSSYEGKLFELKHIETVLGVRSEFESSLERMRTLARSESAKGGGQMAPLMRRGSLLEQRCEEPEAVAVDYRVVT